MTKTEFLLTILIQYQPDKGRELRKISNWGWLVDPILNSLNQNCKNCMVDSKENYKLGLRVKRLKVQKWFMCGTSPGIHLQHLCKLHKILQHLLFQDGTEDQRKTNIHTLSYRRDQRPSTFSVPNREIFNWVSIHLRLHWFVPQIFVIGLKTFTQPSSTNQIQIITMITIITIWSQVFSCVAGSLPESI